MLFRNIKFALCAMILCAGMAMPQASHARDRWVGDAGHKNDRRSLSLNERLKAIGAGAANGTVMALVTGLLLRRGINNAGNTAYTPLERGGSVALYSALGLGALYYGTKYVATQISRSIAARNRKDLGDAYSTVVPVSLGTSAALILGYLGYTFSLL